jgi:flagellar biosynthetic protein FliO
VDSVAVVGRMLISLAVVLGFMWLIARRMKRPGRVGNGDLMDVLSRRQLSRTASVAVVRVLDQALVIGITDGQVSLIGETDLAAAQQAVQSGSPARRSPRPGRPTPKPSPRIGPDGRILTAPAAVAPAAEPAVVALTAPAGRRPVLAGSALSPATWRQTVDSLRNLTTRRS